MPDGWMGGKRTCTAIWGFLCGAEKLRGAEGRQRRLLCARIRKKLATGTGGSMSETARVRKLTILAQDPGVRFNGRLAFAQVDVPAESLASGPTGYRVKVVDFDASSRVAYAARASYHSPEGEMIDPFAPPLKGFKSKSAERKYERALLANPNFHAQNCYAIVMRTLARFEQALGRRVAWGFKGHQIHVVPHAFDDANAFYSEDDRALLFGYFQGRTGKIVHTCLSHDIVAHETVHALLDGLRDRLTDPSGPDQTAFHEGFSDVVALLSIFSLPEIVTAGLDQTPRPRNKKRVRLIPARFLTMEALSRSIITGLAKQMGNELADGHADALRRSVKLEPSPRYLDDPEFAEPHRRGEILVAAMMRAFLSIWVERIEALGTFPGNKRNLDLVIEEGAKAADHLLTIAIRALDYCPAVDITFGDYLAALLTSDFELMPDDSRFHYRDKVRRLFGSYGIVVPTDRCDAATGTWKAFTEDPKRPIAYYKTNFESMLRDKEEVFRFIWENREPLKVDSRGYTECISVRPCVRQAADGFILRETVCEYVQIAKIFGAEAKSAIKIDRPNGMSTRAAFTVYGGGLLIFDQYGRINTRWRNRSMTGRGSPGGWPISGSRD